MHPDRSFTVSCLVLVVLAALSGQAFAKTLIVGTCPGGTYTTIQSAVTAAGPGSIVQVCPGNYPEQVTITRKITLEGISSGLQDAAVILPPAGGLVVNAYDFDNAGFPDAAQILVEGPFVTGVSISNLTVDATGNQIGGCTPNFIGILFQNASGTLDHVAVRNQVPNGTPNGCQSGLGIYVQTAAGYSSTLTVENSSVHNYNKNGITGNDPNTTLNATANYVQGSGPVPGVAGQNGIQLGFGATGKISSNTVIDNNYTNPSVAAACDILLYDTAEYSHIAISDNMVGNAQIPIALVTYADDGGNLGDGVSVTGNHVYGTSVYDGIDVCTNGNTVTGNTIFNSADSAVHLDDSCGVYFGGNTGEGNTATGNTILESGCAGILDDWSGTGDNTYGVGTQYTVPFTIAYDSASCVLPGAGPVHARGKVSPKK